MLSLGLSLTSVPVLGQIWSPAALFSGGGSGLWLDPSHLPSLSQDAAGTIPVTAPGQPVGLIRDRSGLGHHAAQAVSAARPVWGRHPASGLRNRANGAQAVGSGWAASGLSNGLTHAKVATGTEAGVPYIDIRLTGTATAAGHVIGWNEANSRIAMTSGDAVASVTARVIAGTPPAGTATSGLRLRLTEHDAANAEIGTATRSAPANGVTDATIALVRAAATPGVASLRMAVTVETGPAETVDVTYRVKGLQFEQGATPTALQHNLGADDITEPGVPDLHHMRFDGIDDWLGTPVINWGTDEVTVVMAVAAQPAPVQSILMHGGGNFSPTSFAMVKLSDNRVRWRSAGTLVSITDSTAVVGPRQILSGLGGIGTDTAALRTNGAAVSTSSADQGAGNFADYPVAIGSGHGGSQLHAGHIYGFLAINRVLPPAELARAEAWAAARAGVTLA